MIFLLILVCALVYIGCLIHGFMTYPAIELRILTIIQEAGEIKGRNLRQQLYNERVLLSRARFYVTMGHLEDADLIEGWNKPENVHGHIIELRWYRIKEEGGKRVEEKSLSRALVSLFPIPV